MILKEEKLNRTHRAFGIKTGRIYAEGTKENINNLLQIKYPSWEKTRDGRTIQRNPIYPEPLVIARMI